jgi:hypothetical protein
MHFERCHQQTPPLSSRKSMIQQGDRGFSNQVLPWSWRTIIFNFTNQVYQPPPTRSSPHPPTKYKLLKFWLWSDPPYSSHTPQYSIMMSLWNNINEVQPYLLYVMYVVDTWSFQKALHKRGNSILDGSFEQKQNPSCGDMAIILFCGSDCHGL